MVETTKPGVLQVPHGERFWVIRHDDRGVGYDEYDLVAQQLWSHHVRLGADGTGTRRSLPFRYEWPSEMDLMARLARTRLYER